MAIEAVRCPHCNRILYNRKIRRCGYCQTALPDNILLPPSPEEPLQQTTEDMPQRQTEFLKRIGGEVAQDVPVGEEVPAKLRFILQLLAPGGAQDRRAGQRVWGMIGTLIVVALLALASQWMADFVATPALRITARHNEQLSRLEQEDSPVDLTWEQFVTHVTQYPSLHLAVVGLHSVPAFAVVAPYVDLLHARLNTRLSLVAGVGDGGETLARQLARSYGLPLSEIPAETSQYGPAAEPIQHKQIVQAADAMLVWVTSTSIGPLNAIALARAKGIPVYIVRVE